MKDEQPATVGSLKLTNERPSASVELKQDTLDQVPAVLEVSVTKVANPEKTPVVVYVYLFVASKDSNKEDVKIPIGNFSLYPPDQPGKFLMRASGAIEKLKTAKKESSSTLLFFELKRLHEAKAWTPVELSITPGWRSDLP